MPCVTRYYCDLPKLASSLPLGHAPLALAHFLIHFPLLPGVVKLSQQRQSPIQDSQPHVMVAHGLGRVAKVRLVPWFKHRVPEIAAIALQMWPGDPGPFCARECTNGMKDSS